MQIRAIAKADIPSLLRIEQAVQVAPWTLTTFQVCLEAGQQGWALEEAGCMLGFVIASTTLDECHILNIAVAKEAQHRGIATQLLTHLLSKISKQGMSVVYLEVRRTNSRAIALYQRFDFQQIGERKDYYQTVSGTEDALILAKVIQPTTG